MIHSHALVDDPQAIPADTNVWAFAHVMRGARVGRGCNIGDHAFIESGAVVGDRVTIKNAVLVWEGIRIEDDAFIGPAVTFTNDRYPRSPRMHPTPPRYADKADWLVKTTVGRGASIGAGAILCPGVHLGRYSMVAAGSVVTQDVECYSLVMGSPARQVDYVCRCGQKLAGHYLHCDCSVCGETAASRVHPNAAASATP
ncbi:acyltransferase [Roseimaritima sediminicola]|uniref:acyltransferase n=1 Tax=Roseimaritima sediminicola TaxID=2662066 RepID=UPI001298513F|nr:acyltransferase [Roseimaritima sediminicola]